MKIIPLNITVVKGDALLKHHVDPLHLAALPALYALYAAL